jgi:hypothetical protein
LSTTVLAENIEDAIVLAKARAIEKGCVKPKKYWVKGSVG